MFPTVIRSQKILTNSLNYQPQKLSKTVNPNSKWTLKPVTSIRNPKNSNLKDSPNKLRLTLNNQKKAPAKLSEKRGNIRKLKKNSLIKKIKQVYSYLSILKKVD